MISQQPMSPRAAPTTIDDSHSSHIVLDVGPALTHHPSPLTNHVLARRCEEMEAQGGHRVPGEAYKGRQVELLFEVPVVVSGGPQLNWRVQNRCNYSI